MQEGNKIIERVKNVKILTYSWTTTWEEGGVVGNTATMAAFDYTASNVVVEKIGMDMEHYRGRR